MERVNATSLVKMIAVVLAVALLAGFSYNPLKERIKLGLDLKGGLHVVMEAQEKEGRGYPGYHPEINWHPAPAG